jgi:hypothetical protein
MGDVILTLRGLGDEVVAQEHCVVRSGLTSVGTTDPVSVSVDDEVRRRGAAKKQAMVEGVLGVSEDVLHGREMRLMRIVHMEAHLLGRVGNIKPGEGEVLENLGQAAVGSWVTNKGHHVGGDLVLSVNRRGAGLVVGHASALKDVPSVLVLVKEEIVMSLLHRDVEQVVKRVEVLHCERLSDNRSGMLEKV